MSDELKACPFCGEPADDRYNRLAKCSNKSCLMNHWVDDEDFFIDDDWNTRPIEDALRARITELKEFIDQLIEAGKGLLDSLCTDPEEEKTVEVMNWKAVVDKVNKERER